MRVIKAERNGKKKRDYLKVKSLDYQNCFCLKVFKRNDF